MDVFISYKKERRLHVQRLAAILEAYGFEVWWDYELLVGPTYTAQLETKLNEAKAVIVLWCSGSRQSRYVQDEARIAQQRSKLLPAKLEDVEPPLGFGIDQWASLVGWTGTPDTPGVAALVTALDRLAPRSRKSAHNVLSVLGQLPPILEASRLPTYAIDSNAPASEAIEHIPPTPHSPLPVPEGAPASEIAEFHEWVRREIYDDEWDILVDGMATAIVELSRADPDPLVALDVRRWGERIIIDVQLKRFANPRRVIIADIGGAPNYPGHQLEIYSDAQGIHVEYERVRWMTDKKGRRLLLRVIPSNKRHSFTAPAYANHIWLALKKL